MSRWYSYYSLLPIHHSIVHSRLWFIFKAKGNYEKRSISNRLESCKGRPGHPGNGRIYRHHGNGCYGAFQIR